MSRKLFAITGVVSLLGLALACNSNSNMPLTPTTPIASGTSSAPDGSTLKVSAPVPQSPIGGQKASAPTVLVASASTATFGGTVALQYRFQISDSANALVQDSGLVNAPTFAVTAKLQGNASYTWRARAEAQGGFGPWSTAASFIGSDSAFIRGSQVVDPLTTGTTVGVQHGGHFVAGQGWQADGFNDGIDYDIATCSSCTVEFDVTQVGKGLGNSADLKFLTMGDATAFGSFSVFRDHPWKMHLEQRADGDGTAMKLIWRNGRVGAGDPGDHTDVEPPNKAGGPNWQGSTVFHFVFNWTPRTFSIAINGVVWFSGFFDNGVYAPPNHRVSLGCYPRSETLIGAIWRNVRVTPN